MPIHLRQICLVAYDLASVQDELEDVLSIKPAFHDDGVSVFGLQNVLMPIGSQMLEVVAPQPGADPMKTAAGRYIDRRGGDGGYMVITQVPDRRDQDAARARAAERKVRVAWENDRQTWNVMQLHPRDLGSCFFEIDWDEQADMHGNWMPAGGTAWKEAVCTDTVGAITGVELQSADPVEEAKVWAYIADTQVVMDRGDPTVPLANATLRFIPDRDGRGPGLSGLELNATDAERLFAQADARGCHGPAGVITICGTRFTTKD